MRNKNKTRPFLHIILSIKVSLQKQIHNSGNIFGNKCCRCNEGSLYKKYAVLNNRVTTYKLHLFTIGKILAIFDLQVTPVLLTKFLKSIGLSVQKKTRQQIFKLEATATILVSLRKDFSYLWSTG